MRLVGKEKKATSSYLWFSASLIHQVLISAFFFNFPTWKQWTSIAFFFRTGSVEPEQLMF